MAERATWTTRIGFLVAAIGSAVGLGNIWQFPFKTGANGGSSFLVFYLIAVVAIGFPALLGEFVLGRRTRLNAIDAFGELGHRQWRIVGALGVATGFWILSYYNVVGGWVMRYIVGSATGAYFDAPAEYFGAVSAGPEAIAAQALFVLVVVGIVALGVEDGIEKATKVMVPSIVLLMLAMAVWAFTLEGGAAGYEYFLSPDLDTLLANAGTAIPFAVSQAFFTLSLGMAIMVTFSSYVGNDDNLAVDGGIIVGTNTLIGVLAGLVVFPVLFANGIDPATSGPSAIFIAMASGFAELPAGRLLGVVFFGVVLIAALSSAISLLEVSVSWATDNYDIGRVPLAAGLGVGLFVLGLPSAWDTAWLTWFDNLAYQLLLPVSVLFAMLFVGWVLGDEALTEIRQGMSGMDWFGPAWLWTVRIVVVAGVAVTLVLGLRTLFVEGAIVPPV
ncbi:MULTISPECIES: sodium-dependent transporter [Halomicrobium]|uniref:Sodium:neurotransmitter symporter n=2 Tax=Halomicrobium mukohataei TaxID=57705 RepID=C7NYY7_HALMD|nr:MULTISPECIES: sodium-dependent transporter [Halomicrobium]ACV48676.1 sodium:neurotransmitter symporter [Halomicrobium mukohataei DSM 12286]QCD64107.1 sodium-dependent transporter [Halomicrobium mukohataei]QFR18913.1 sodium-dependent transporter [Halomicrobium sp. ZPS1]